MFTFSFIGYFALKYTCLVGISCQFFSSSVELLLTTPTGDNTGGDLLPKYQKLPSKGWLDYLNLAIRLMLEFVAVSNRN